MGTQATWIEQQPFLMDIEQLHWNACRELKQARESSSHPGSDTLIQLLGHVQLLELALTFRNLYKSRAAAKKQAPHIADKLMEHAMEKQTHAEAVSGRIARLGGENIWNANGLPPTSHLSRLEGVSLADMVQESLLAETFLVDLCRRFLEFLGSADDSTSALIERILDAEERQTIDLNALLEDVAVRRLDAATPDRPNDQAEDSWEALFASRQSNRWFREMFAKRRCEE